MKPGINTEEQSKNSSTHDRIFKTAVELFSKKGFNGVSVRDITRSVGVNESSLYNHFKNKEGLMDAILDFFKAELNSSVFDENEITKAIDSFSPLGFLNLALDEFAQMMSNDEMNKIGRILTIEQFSSESIRNLFEQELIQKPRMIYKTAFAKMIEKKLIKPLEPEMLAEEYISFSIRIYYEYAVLKHEETSVEDIKRLVSNHIEFFWNMVKI